MAIDLQAQTEQGHHWTCCECNFSSRSLAAALQHCEERSGEYPRAEHMLHELDSAPEHVARNRARRVISCRDEDGHAMNARVVPNRWRYIDGRWEIKGVTA